MAIASLEEFLSNVRQSCEEHAERKGYLEPSGLNPLIEIEKLMGTTRHHAIGEIVAKLLEFQRTPRQVLAEKVAGWAWRLWVSVEANEYDAVAHNLISANRSRFDSHTVKRSVHEDDL